jgi:hypothetical protein
VVFPTPPFWFAIVMMAVMRFCLRPRGQDEAPVVRQPCSYIWVLAAENPKV